MNVFEQKNAELVTEFDRYVREHPDFAERIPDNGSWPCWLKGMKHSISGVKKGQNGKQKKNSRLCT